MIEKYFFISFQHSFLFAEKINVQKLFNTKKFLKNIKSLLFFQIVYNFF